MQLLGLHLLLTRDLLNVQNAKLHSGQFAICFKNKFIYFLYFWFVLKTGFMATWQNTYVRKHTL